MASQQHSSAKHHTNFLGLRWKVALTLIITILIISLIIVYFIEHRSTRAFNTLNNQQAQRSLHNWYGRLEEGRQIMLQLAAFIPLLQVNDEQDPSQRLNQIIAEHSALLDLEWGILSISFFDQNGTEISSWPKPVSSPQILDLVADTLTDEFPNSLIVCGTECVQYVAVPQLTTEESNASGGILLMGRSLADAIVSFSQASEVELVILFTPKTDEPQKLPRNRHLKSWQRFTPALSNPSITLSLVRSLEQQYTLEELTNSQLFSKDGRWYHITTSFDRNSAYLLLKDVSDQVKRQNNTRTFIIFSGVAGFVFTTLLLFFLLRAPLNRLHALAHILPLIGEHKHDETCERLQSIERHQGRRDEIDQLVTIVGELNHQLKASDDARNSAEERLIWLADHDPLTGLINRRRFQMDFEQIINQSTKTGFRGALLYYDLDDFKTVNDLSGHQAGDELLKKLGTSLQGSLRSTDLYARLGGDEFAIVLPDATRIYAENMAKRVIDNLHQLEFFLNNARHRLSASVGITLFPQNGDGFMELLSKADIAMYEAKRLGGSCWHTFSENDELLQILSERTRWRDKINHALENDQFELRFQPIFDLEQNAIVRHEALIQMRDEDGSKINPDQFIPIAEQTGQILALDRWVVENSINLIRDNPSLSLSVNISGSVMDAPGLLEWLTPLLKSEGVDPTRIVFEITETVAIENIDGAVEVIDTIHQLGCRFALDDFGSGYASYNYLKRFPVDLVKIDGAYVRNLLFNREDQLFVKALSELAHGLGRELIAEFVGDKDTLALLRDFGVRYAQGYYIGKPMSKPITQPSFT